MRLLLGCEIKCTISNKKLKKVSYGRHTCRYIVKQQTCLHAHTHRVCTCGDCSKEMKNVLTAVCVSRLGER